MLIILKMFKKRKPIAFICAILHNTKHEKMAWFAGYYGRYLGCGDESFGVSTAVIIGELSGGRGVLWHWRPAERLFHELLFETVRRRNGRRQYVERKLSSSGRL